MFRRTALHGTCMQVGLPACPAHTCICMPAYMAHAYMCVAAYMAHACMCMPAYKAHGHVCACTAARLEERLQVRILLGQLQEHGVIKELVDGHVVTHALAPPSLDHELTGQGLGGAGRGGRARQGRTEREAVYVPVLFSNINIKKRGKKREEENMVSPVAAF